MFFIRRLEEPEARDGEKPLPPRHRRLLVERLERRELLTYDFSPVVELGNPPSTGTLMYVSAVAEDAAGDFVVAGSFSGTWNFNPKGSTFNVSSSGLTDGFVAKYAPDGTNIWMWHYYVDGGSSEANAVAVDPSGNVVVVGAENSKLFVQKHDGATGSVDWTRQFDGGVGNGVAVDSYGNVFVTGTFSASMTFSQGGTPTLSQGSTDIFALEINGLTGVTGWGHDLGGAYADQGYGIAVDNNDDVYIVGQYELALSYESIYLAKLSQGGSLAWERKYAAPVSGVFTPLDLGQSVAVDPKGNAYVYGYFYDSVNFGPGSVGSLNSGGGTSQFVLKVDASGNSEWATNLAHQSASFAGGIVVDGSGNIYIASSASVPVLGSGGTTTDSGLFEARLDGSGEVTASQLYGLSSEGPSSGGIAINGAGTVREEQSAGIINSHS